MTNDALMPQRDLPCEVNRVINAYLHPPSFVEGGGGTIFRNKGWVAKILGSRGEGQSSHFKILKWGVVFTVLIEKTHTPETKKFFLNRLGWAIIL